MEIQPIPHHEIATSVSSRPIEELWSLWREQVQTLKPFWLMSTETFAIRLGLPDEKRHAHLNAIANAFHQMDDWRFKRIKYVKARRNEIESAISFILNKALEKPVSRLVIAAPARNAATALRVLLTASCRGYSDEQLPGCFSHAI